MTIAIAWVSEGEAFLCWDSAESRDSGRPQVPISSFGERHDVDGKPVEEAVIKLHQVGGLPVLIVGAVRPALVCCDELELSLPNMGVREALAYVHPLFKDDSDSFSLLIAHRAGSEVVVTCFSSRNGVEFDDEGSTIWILGSLPDALVRIVRSAVHGVVTKMPLMEAQKLMAVLAILQALGVANYLPRHGVGGAMWGARFRESLVWQEPIVFLISDPVRLSRLRNAPQATLSAKLETFAPVRCHIADGVGVVISAITNHITIVTSPREQRDEEQLKAIAEALPMPGQPVAPVGYYAFIEASKQRVVLVVPRSDPPSKLARVVTVEGDLRLKLGTVILSKLTEPVANDQWELFVYCEDEGKPGHRFFGVHIYLDGPRAGHD